ncbi:MAG: hypothetical protein M1819_001019 [Sarea resinae]|nr:MAG: hypothetical protein M1819_001019 [Sarea resinae]
MSGSQSWEQGDSSIQGAPDLDTDDPHPNDIPQIAPFLDQLRKIAGVPGLCVGVIHSGQLLYQGSFGFQYIDGQDGKIPPNAETIFCIASLTKVFTAVAVGILVEDGLLQWTTPLYEIIPELAESISGLGKDLNVVDLLSHRSGLAPDCIWSGSDNELLLSKADCVKMFNTLKTVRPFRQGVKYSDLAFCVVGEAIERLTGMSYGAFVKKRIFDPLGMRRTFTEDPSGQVDNVSRSYASLSDGTPYQISPPRLGDRTLMAPAAGIRSCVNDLLHFYAAIMVAASEQATNQTTSTPGSPLKQLSTIMAGHVHMPCSGQQFALGWIRAELPNSLGAINRILLPSAPDHGIGGAPRLAYAHEGMLPGCSSAAYLFPETSSAIVVLQNSIGLCDLPDWIGHMMISRVFSTPFPPLDYVSLVKQSSQAGAGYQTKIQHELDRQRGQIQEAPHRPLSDYAGSYINAIGNLSVNVSVQPNPYTQGSEQLYFRFQGLAKEQFALRFYMGHTFRWDMSRDEFAVRARHIYRSGYYYMMCFETGTERDSDYLRDELRDLHAYNMHIPITQLRWRHDHDVEEGEVFTKQGIDRRMLEWSAIGQTELLHF